MTTILIGSAAVNYHYPDFPREPKDLDYWSDKIKPAGLVDVFWHPKIGDYYTRRFTVATPDELYTMKVSHSPWVLENGSWSKHMHDVVWLRERGCRLIPELHDLLYGIWEERHGAKRVNLNQESGKFFTDAVTRIYDHDSIHETVAYYHRPLWTEVLKEGQTVAMDMQKVWNWLPFAEQVKLFREEIYATALERWLIPTDYCFSPRHAYALALKKTITSLTKGDSARFLIENYKIFRDPDVDYLARHLLNRHKLVKLEGR